jgi:hypothetical protein
MTQQEKNRVDKVQGGKLVEHRADLDGAALIQRFAP